MNFLNGKKVYLVALITIIYSLAGAYLKFIPWQTAIDQVLAALGAIGFRHAMA